MVRAKKASATIEFVFENARNGKIVRQALKPEEALPASARSRATIRQKENVLCLQVNAENTAAMRATLNSFIRWVMIARDMIELGEE